jgi:hypothetical protein
VTISAGSMLAVSWVTVSLTGLLSKTITRVYWLPFHRSMAFFPRLRNAQMVRSNRKGEAVARTILA